jgi:hypothetical protein
VIAYGLEYLGAVAAGAVIPASVQHVGQDAWLMYLASTLGRYTGLLEGEPVVTDV